MESLDIVRQSVNEKEKFEFKPFVQDLKMILRCFLTERPRKYIRTFVYLTILQLIWKSSRHNAVTAKVLPCELEVSEFELQSCNHVHFLSLIFLGNVNLLFPEDMD